MGARSSYSERMKNRDKAFALRPKPDSEFHQGLVGDDEFIPTTKRSKDDEPNKGTLLTLRKEEGVISF